MTSKSIQGYVRMFLGATIAYGCILRVMDLDAESLWIDELMSVFQSSHSYSFLLEAVRRDVHPPLYQSLLWAWMGLVGDSETAVRSLSTIFGLIAVGFFCWQVSRFLSLSDALAATALLSASYFAIYYSKEARAYELLLLFSVVITTSYVNINRALSDASGNDGHSRMDFILLSSGSILAACTHLYGFLLAFVANSLLLMTFWTQFKIRTKAPYVSASTNLLIISMILLLCLYLSVNLENKVGGKFWIPPPDGGLILSILSRIFGSMSAVILFFVITTASIIKLATADYFFWRKIPEATSLLALLGISLSLALLTSLHTPTATARNFIILLPGFLLLLMLLWTKAWGQSKGQVLVLVMSLTMLHAASQRLDLRERQPWREAAQRVQEFRPDERPVIFVDRWAAKHWNYYLKQMPEKLPVLYFNDNATEAIALRSALDSGQSALVLKVFDMDQQPGYRAFKDKLGGCSYWSGPGVNSFLCRPGEF